MNRRAFLNTAAGMAATSGSARAANDADVRAVHAEAAKHHDENVRRLQDWIRQPSIAAENIGMEEGCKTMMRLLEDAGFGKVSRVPTKGFPGVTGMLDAGAPRTLGVYFMYDVKQVEPKEWSSPPWEAALVDRPGVGQVVMGRGAVNQKGPQSAFLAALHAFRRSGRKLPVNVVLVAEGEEEIGSENLAHIVQSSNVFDALRRSIGVVMPSASQGLDGRTTISLGAKGDVEVELVCSGEKWGRGPTKDVHSSNAARLDSPMWHLVQALASLVEKDGFTPAIDGFADKARPISEAEKAMVREAARRSNEQLVKKQLGVTRWVRDVSWPEALELFVSRPTVTIEGLIGGYSGPGGKTAMPHKASAKLDIRLVPDMTAEGTIAALKAHLVKRGFGDIEIIVLGGAYEATSTPADAAMIRAQAAVLKRAGIQPLFWPRNAGSWPGVVFTGDPMRLPAGHFGLGHGAGAHGPDEFYVIESAVKTVAGYDGAVGSFIDYLYELASVSE